MYTKYYGFNEKPFTLTPNPRFIYLSKNHKEAFAHLLYGINNHYGFIELIGEVGTGKTTVLRTLLSQLDDASYRSALIFNPCLTGVELLHSINHEFGLDSGSEFSNELLEELNGFLLRENQRGITVVLVIDEAQNLSPEILEQLRLISNLETENDKLIQIVLAGQLELSALLELPELRQLNQRIAVRYRLKSMSTDETRCYIRHRMVIAGETGGVSFSRSALTLIHLFSCGLPRLINNICDRALLIGYGDERRRITGNIVIRAIKELINATRIKRFFLLYAGVICIAIVLPVCLSVFSGYWRPGKRDAGIQRPAPSVAAVNNTSAHTPAAAKRVSEPAAPRVQTPPHSSKPELTATVRDRGNNYLETGNLKQKTELNKLRNTSQNISALQQLLKQAGMYNGAIDGKYGTATAKAVNDFQMLAGISPDETVGESTREALARYYTNKKVPTILSAGSAQ